MNDQPSQLPHAPNAEAAVLAMLIERPTGYWPLVTASQIDADHFHVPGHRELWDLMCERRSKNQPCDPASLRDDVMRKRAPALTLQIFSGVLATEIDPSAWEAHLEALRDRLALRIAALAGSGATCSKATGESMAKALRAAADRASAILSGSSIVISAGALVREFLDSLREQPEDRDLPALTTGIVYLDKATGGMRPGQFWVVAGKPSRGKTLLMLQITNGAVQAGHRVLVFTLEMSRLEVMQRLVSTQGGINLTSITNPKDAPEEDIRRAEAVAESFDGSKLMICDKAPLTIDEIAGHAQRIADTQGVDLIVIDYLQLVHAIKVKGQNREQEVAYISRTSKMLAKKLGCPVLAAAQLNENGETRESRAIQQDADNLFLIADDGLLAWKLRNGVRNTRIKGYLAGGVQQFVFTDMDIPAISGGR